MGRTVKTKSDALVAVLSVGVAGLSLTIGGWLASALGRTEGGTASLIVVAAVVLSLSVLAGLMLAAPTHAHRGGAAESRRTD